MPREKRSPLSTCMHAKTASFRTCWICFRRLQAIIYIRLSEENQLLFLLGETATWRMKIRRIIMTLLTLPWFMVGLEVQLFHFVKSDLILVLRLLLPHQPTMVCEILQTKSTLRELPSNPKTWFSWLEASAVGISGSFFAVPECASFLGWLIERNRSYRLLISQSVSQSKLSSLSA